jgi:hypothetical protein
MAMPAWFFCFGSAATAVDSVVDYQTVCRVCGLQVEVVHGLIAEHGARELLPWDGRSTGELVLN